ncbi:hypothetical protein MNBD_ACTINO01-2438 [hydrothermal vent metagenome]|uniref:Uncharacterized protein n=1 Tax=hydrothermal vent metagenome TaxID=652676 RepID=A0A3B0SV78_9ZZZZ
MTDPTELIRKLADVQDRILALPDDAFAQRWELRKEQDDLRSQAQEFAYAMDEDKFDDELLSELRALRDRMKAIEHQRIDLVGQAGGGSMSGEMGNLGGVKINRGIDDAMGLPGIKARIGVIKGVLMNRGVDIPPAD